jgi:hypothetical protein
MTAVEVGDYRGIAVPKLRPASGVRMMRYAAWARFASIGSP